LLQLERFEDAEKSYRELINDNPDATAYYGELAAAMQLSEI
jgi:hypothetical protein